MEEKKKKKEIDALLQKCYSIYFSINHGNNTSEFSEDNKNIGINNYLKPYFSNEKENLEMELKNWKKQIKELENKLKSIQSEGINTNGFLDIFSLIKSIINNQEEKLKEMKLAHNKNKLNSDAGVGVSSLSDFANKLKDLTHPPKGKESKNNTIIADYSNINYNKVDNNRIQIIKQVIEELNTQVLNLEETKFTNLNKKNKNSQNDNNDNNNKNSSYPKEKTATNFLQPNNIVNDEEMKDDFESKLNNGLNPSKLILNIEDEINQDNLVQRLQENLEINKCYILPQYNLTKLLSTTFDKNSIEYEDKNVYYNIFPAIEKDECKISCKKLIDGLDSQMSIIQNDPKKLPTFEKDFSDRYQKLTPLQKLIILNGIFAYGNNPYLINYLLNMYLPTHCIIFPVEEMSYICRKVLEEMGINYESTLYDFKDDFLCFNTDNQFQLTTTQKVDIESAIYISEYTDFEYNNTIRKIFELKDDNNKDEFNKIFLNIKNKDQYKLSCNFNLKTKNLKTKGINFFNVVTKNSYITDQNIKSNFLSKIKDYFKQLCQKIKEFQFKNKSNYNYFTGEQVFKDHRQINDMNYPEIIANKNKKLNKNDVLEQLENYKGIVSIKKYKEQMIHKENEPKEAKASILSVINTYHEDNIKSEWDNMKKVWYQNNQRFNYIFKLSDKIDYPKKTIVIPNQQCENDMNRNNSNEQEDLMHNISMIKTNQ